MKSQVAFCLIAVSIVLCVSGEFITSEQLSDLFIKMFNDNLSSDEASSLEDVFEVFKTRISLFRSSWSHSTLSLRAKLNCVLCRSTASAVFAATNNGSSFDQITNVLTRLCVGVGIQNDGVCRGFIKLNLPIITHIIKTTPEATPATFCGVALQDEEDQEYCSFEDSRFDWTVQLPGHNKKRTSRSKKSKKASKRSGRHLKAVILPDTHIDPLYEAYGVADCDMPTCCRRGQSRSLSQTMLFKTDGSEEDLKKIFVNINNKEFIDLSVASKLRESRRSYRTVSKDSAPAGYWGDYRSCDTPQWAFNNLIDTIAKTHPDIDVVYYIGDTIDHGVWETSNKLVLSSNKYLINKIQQTFGDIPVLPVIGNHDTHPANQFAPSKMKRPCLNSTWLYNTLANKWRNYLDDDALASFRSFGGYSQLVRPGLRAISINNNVAYKSNWWLVYDPADATLHLDFLVKELQKAEDAGEKVHLLVHIPPGCADLTYTWTREYNRIVNRFSSTIAAEFNGHVHADEFKIFFNEKGEPINVAWGGGSATSYSNYNLNYKVVTFDSKTFAPDNIRSYSYNLREANLTPDESPKWYEMYSLPHSYNLTDLKPATMNKFVQKMAQTKGKLLARYTSYYSKKSDLRMSGCDEKCIGDNLCRIMVTVLWDRRKCEEIKSLYYRAERSSNHENVYVSGLKNWLHYFQSFLKRTRDG